MRRYPLSPERRRHG